MLYYAIVQILEPILDNAVRASYVPVYMQTYFTLSDNMAKTFVFGQIYIETRAHAMLRYATLCYAMQCDAENVQNATRC